MNSWRDEYFGGLPLKIGNEVQLLLDDFIVEDRFGLRRVVGLVEKFTDNPLPVDPILPWEEKCFLQSYGRRDTAMVRIIYDPKEKLYKGWYLWIRSPEAFELSDPYQSSMLYMESTNGVTWRKPELDFFTLDGQKTNLVLHPDGPKGRARLDDILENPDPTDPEKRYIGFAGINPPDQSTRRVLMKLYSPDGRKWTLADDPVMLTPIHDGNHSIVRDEVNSRWLLYQRPSPRALKREGFYEGANIKRRVCVATSNDLQYWTYPRVLALPDEIDETDIDRIRVFRYRGLYFGLIGLMNNPATSPLQTQLMFSRDGFTWDRLPDRPAFVDNGVPGEWDEGWLNVHSLIPEGERIRIYYTACNLPQTSDKQPRMRGTGLAYIGRDRFIGQQAGPEGGYLLTREFVLEGDRLEVNYCCAKSAGLIKAEILERPDEPGKQPVPLPMEGFSMDDCDTISAGDNLQRVLTWKGSSDLSTLTGKKVYIRFFVQNATLYAFRIGSKASTQPAPLPTNL